jgi:putative sigma-54 modulation protein
MPSRSEMKDKFSAADYPIHITARHVEITDPIKTYAVEKLEAKLKLYSLRVLKADVIMDIQKKINHLVDFNINVNNIHIKVSGSSDNMYASIDQAIDHLDIKLAKYHKRITDHHVKGLPELEMNVNVVSLPVEDINDQIEEETLLKVEKEMVQPSVSSQVRKKLKFLTVNEAVMKMELSGDHFLVYKSEEDRKLKVMYRRGDGNYGIIEPEM